MDTWGRIDGLIHNAAIVLDDHFEDVTDDDLDSIMTVNLRGTFRTVRAVYRAMKDTGGGRIVTLTSASGLSGAFGQAAYATTKMGVLGITRSVAWEGMRFGIKVNALAPAAFDTRLFEVFTPDGDAALRGRPPGTRDLVGLSGIRRPADRKPGHPDGAGAGTSQLPSDRRDLRRHRRLLLPVRHLAHRGRNIRSASDRRGHRGQLGPHPRCVTAERTRRRGDGVGREGVFDSPSSTGRGATDSRIDEGLKAPSSARLLRESLRISRCLHSRLGILSTRPRAHDTATDLTRRFTVR